MNIDPAIRIYERPRLTDAVLLVAFREDVSRMGSRTVEYLRDKLGCREFAEILPQHFYSMTGVAVDNNVAQFPDSKFYVSEDHKLVIFDSNLPQIDWYRFLNIVLDFARNDCGVGEIFTLGATLSVSSHTMPRRLFAVASSAQSKSKLEPAGITGNFDFETMPGQKPAFHSYLLWMAKKQGMEGACLWVSVPFYLVMLDDPGARKKTVEFFNSYLNLGINTDDLQDEVDEQANKIAELTSRYPEMGDYLQKLEIGEGLDTAESEKLTREIVRFLRKK